MDSTYFWDLDQRISIVPLLNGEARMIRGLKSTSGPSRRDKHWIPLIQDHHAFFVRFSTHYKCCECEVSTDKCRVHFPPTPNHDSADPLFIDALHAVRGGTPFQHWVGSYYWSITHSTMFSISGQRSRRIYTMNFLMVHTDPFRVVFYSDPILLAESMFANIPNFQDFLRKLVPSQWDLLSMGLTSV